EAERARLEHNQQELETQLQEQRTAGETQPSNSLTPDEALTKMQVESVPAFILSPALRGTGHLATIPVPARVKQIKVRLQLEATDFPGYRVTLKDPATNQAVWRSGEIKAEDTNKGKAVSVLLSTRLLKQQNYTFELSGIRERGASELISSYPFRFVVK